MDKKELVKSALELLTNNILPFWQKSMVDTQNGGFYGRRDGNGILHSDAEKGAVLNARILWAFSAAYRVLKQFTIHPHPELVSGSHLHHHPHPARLRCENLEQLVSGSHPHRHPELVSGSHSLSDPDLRQGEDTDSDLRQGEDTDPDLRHNLNNILAIATCAKDYIIQHFIDREYGGVYWSLTADGKPLDTKKQSYAIGFMIYGLSEYARVTGDEEAKQAAINLFHDLENHAFDKQNNGYIEALTREWETIEDMRLSDKDENGIFTMNTHLHIIEPYTNLYRIWKDPQLKKQIINLLNIFMQKLYNPTNGHLDLFFNEHWQGKRNIHSYGHDIEASWLLTETLEVLQDEGLTKATLPYIEHIAEASEEGLQADGSMIHEAHFTALPDSNNLNQPYMADSIDFSRQWWVECEAVIGFLYRYKRTKNEAFYHKAVKAYKYILEHLVDSEQGEWYWAILPNGAVDKENDKAGFWKCPYHNSRMCLEISYLI